MAAPSIPPTGAWNVSPPNGYVAIAEGPQVAQFQMVSGAFVLNGATSVNVSAPQVTATSQIFLSLNTVGGSVGVFPHVTTITPGTGFTVVGTASDVSTYNYMIIG